MFFLSPFFFFRSNSQPLPHPQPQMSFLSLCTSNQTQINFFLFSLLSDRTMDQRQGILDRGSVGYGSVGGFGPVVGWDNRWVSWVGVFSGLLVFGFVWLSWLWFQYWVVSIFPILSSTVVVADLRPLNWLWFQYCWVGVLGRWLVETIDGLVGLGFLASCWSLGLGGWVSCDFGIGWFQSRRSRPPQLLPSILGHWVGCDFGIVAVVGWVLGWWCLWL